MKRSIAVSILTIILLVGVSPVLAQAGGDEAVVVTGIDWDHPLVAVVVISIVSLMGANVSLLAAALFAVYKSTPAWMRSALDGVSVNLEEIGDNIVGFTPTEIDDKKWAAFKRELKAELLVELAPAPPGETVTEAEVADATPA